MTDIYGVYQEFQEDPEEEDCRLIGIYSTYKKAEEAIERFRQVAGACDRPNAINIYPSEIDREGWIGGFAQV